MEKKVVIRKVKTKIDLPTKPEIAKQLSGLSKKLSKLASDVNTWPGYEATWWEMSKTSARMQDWSVALWEDARNDNRTQGG